MNADRSFNRAMAALLLALGGVLAASCAAAAENPENGAGRLTLDLSGQRWQMEGIRPGQGVREGFQGSSGASDVSTYNWNGAEVPGDVYTDLWRAGEIDDPHYGRNGMRAKWVMEKEWWYRRRFGIPEPWRGKTVRLVFEGVDYSCDVWLNGTRLGRHEGMFSSFEFDVSSLLQFSSDRRANRLVVRLDPPPRLYRNVAGRKFSWHGDYWRAITPMGIWKPVRLEATGPIHITNVYPKGELHADGTATVAVRVSLADHGPHPHRNTRVRAVVRGKNLTAGPYEAEAAALRDGDSLTANLAIPIADPKLWWPWDLGRPNLYTAEVSVIDAQGGLLDRSETSFGIREIRMERNPGYTTDEVMYPWTMLINGKRVFLRSANWGGPPDIFYGRNSEAKYRTLVQLAKKANINNLRIFGWHPTEVDRFYELCDELGVTVWQDLIPLASVSLPEDEDFRRATYAEAVAVIKKLRSHPSLVLLEGGEESFYGGQGLEYNARFLLGLGEAIRPHSDLPYVPTSPLNWPPIVRELGIGKSHDSGHTHKLFYAIGYDLMEDYIPTWDFAVIPEFAVSSAPQVESLRKFIPPDELWPPGPSWGYHWADLDVLRALNYQVLGDERIGSVEEFAEATQIAQGTIFQFGIEYMRRRKPKSTAISICHFITFAPDMKWGIVDYFQTPKISYEFVRRAYQPLLVSLDYSKRRWLPGETFEAGIWLVNDFHRNFGPLTLQVDVSDHRGNQLATRTYDVQRVAADSSTQAHRFDWKVRGVRGETFRIDVRLRDKAGEILSANQYVLLLDDQEAARKRCRERAIELQTIRNRFGKADYYRFFPAYSGPERTERFGDKPPSASTGHE